MNAKVGLDAQDGTGRDCERKDASEGRAERVGKTQAKGAGCRWRSSAMRKGKKWATYDWALDLEPLALPPDLPPVIVKSCVGVVKLGKFVKVAGWDGRSGRAWVCGVETMDGGQSSGRRAAYKAGAGVLWCARSDCR